MYLPLCRSDWTLCILVLPRGVTIPQAPQAGPEGLACIRCIVGVAGLGPCIPRSPTGRPYPPSGPSRIGGTQVHPPLCGSGWALCIPVLPRAVPIPQAAQGGGGDSGVYTAVWEQLALVYPGSPKGAVPIPQAAQERPEGLGCIRHSMGVGGPCVSSFSHGASLSPKRPRHDRRDLGVPAAAWEWLGPCIGCSRTGRPYPPSGPGGTGETRVYPPMCGIGRTLCILVLQRGVPIPQPAQAGVEVLECICRYVDMAGPCVSSFSHGGVPIPQAAEAGLEGLGCIRCCVGVARPCVSSFTHGASLSLKRLRQHRRDSGVSAAVWEWVDFVYPRSPKRRPYPHSGQGGTGGHRCICRCVGVIGPCVSLFSHGASLFPKRPRQDRRDSRVSAAVWEWLGPVHTCSPTGGPYPPSGPRRRRGLRCIHRCVGAASPSVSWFSQGSIPIPQAAQERPEGLGCIRRSTGVGGPCVSLFSHWASLSPKRPRHDRGDLGVPAAVWEWLGPCIGCSLTGCPYPPSGPGGTGGTRVYPPMCGVAAPCVSSFSNGASLSPNRPTQDWRYSSVSAAMWIWLHLVYPRSCTGRPYPPSGPGRNGGTRVSPSLCGNGWTLCILVLPRGVPIPQATQARPEGLECIRRCVGVARPCIPRSPTGASLFPKWPR